MLLSTRPSSGDAVAGVSVALVAIPQSLAYAELAGLPAQYGLFASALPALLAAFFVSSPYLQTGPVALTALLTFGALSPLATEFSTEYIALAALLALLVGGLRVALGLLRLGRVAYLLSEPVLLGFTSGAAVLIVSSQLPKVFDVDPDRNGVLTNAADALVHPGAWSWSALGISAMVLALMFGGRRIHKLFPGVLIAVILGLIISKVTSYGGTRVGALDGGFISLSVDLPWSSVGDLLVPAVAIALVGFAEPSSIARAFAAEERIPWDANQEMISQGVANLAAGVSGAFPVGGSFSRSSLNHLAGATSAWAGAITGAFVLLALPFTPQLEDLPQAVLGAVVVGAVIKLIKLDELARMFKASWAQAVVGFGTFAATLATAPSVQYGVIIGVALALSAHLYREMTVHVAGVRDGDMLTVSPQGVLWFATVPALERRVRHAVAEHQGLNRVRIDLGAVGRLDYTGGAALSRLVTELEAGGVSVRVCNVSPAAQRIVDVHLSEACDDD